MKNVFNYFCIIAFAAIFIGMVYASIDSTYNHKKMLEKERIENILKERRNKIDSLKIIEVKPVEE